jgi:hypothetical protein
VRAPELTKVSPGTTGDDVGEGNEEMTLAQAEVVVASASIAVASG